MRILLSVLVPMSVLLIYGLGAIASQQAELKEVLNEDLNEESFKSAFGSNFLVGTAVNEEIVSGEHKQTQMIVNRQFNSVTAENVLKAGPLSPAPKVYDFTAADAFVRYAEEQGMWIVGHTLVWHNQCPEWLFLTEQGSRNTSEQQLKSMRDHIFAVAGRYKGRIHAWDVVNEVIDNDGSYRDTTWVRAVGDGDLLVREAFKYASEAAPGAELYYNDFNAWRPAKRDGIVRMVKMLQQHGIRIDGVGIQGHWGLNFPKNQYIKDAIDAYADLGVKVMITELDVDVLPLTKEGQIIGSAMSHPQFQLEEFKEFLDPYAGGLPPEIEAQHAARYRELFDIFWEKRDKIDRVTFWGVHDDMSWKNDYPIPGRTNYPLIYNRELKAKSAVKDILSVP